MLNSRIARERAESHFLPPVERDEKGTAMRIVAEGVLSVREKSDRLRALRLEREATICLTPAATPARARRKRPA